MLEGHGLERNQISQLSGNHTRRASVGVFLKYTNSSGFSNRVIQTAGVEFIHLQTFFYKLKVISKF